MDKAESKFHNTALKMHQALFELLETYEFQQITIKQITEKAGVNRSTFYAHYENTYELLEDTQKTLLNDFFSKQQPLPQEIENLRLEESNFISAKYIIPCLEFIKENRKIFKVYMNNLNIFQTDSLYQNMLVNVITPIYAKYEIINELVIDYCAKYYLTGMSAIISGWLARDCMDDIYFICEIFILCVNNPNK